MGCGGIILVGIIALVFGINPLSLIGVIDGGGGAMPQAPVTNAPPAANDAGSEFMSRVLGDTEMVWERLFAEQGARYAAPTLVLFDGRVASACGMNSSATGPFYCPPDQKIYIDLSFSRELQRFGAPGDFAMAYVVAHEVGHHIQNLTGTADQVRNLQRRLSQRESNQLSVGMELQADCYAGVWAHHAERERDVLEDGEIEEGLRAAAAVGDDHLMKQAGQPVQPERFTHGTSAQRMEWFKRGFQTGRIDACDTFN
ncbi:MAG: neutral zinc metallopeptidase [Rhodothermales bacterium]